jgi:hypothetical protein
MHYNALRDPQILPDAKHRFDIMCPSALFVGSIPVTDEHEKYCIDISRPGRSGMHYVTRI